MMKNTGVSLESVLKQVKAIPDDARNVEISLPSDGLAIVRYEIPLLKTVIKEVSRILCEMSREEMIQERDRLNKILGEKE